MPEAGSARRQPGAVCATNPILPENALGNPCKSKPGLGEKAGYLGALRRNIVGNLSKTM
jgi:hypothetical protein